MNLKTGLAALAIATAPLTAKAQTAAKTIVKNDSIVNTVRNVAHQADTAATISFAEAQKALGIAKAPKGMVKVTRERGQFVGKIGPQGLNGDLNYRTSSKMIEDPVSAAKTKISYGANYIVSEELPGAAANIYARANKGKVELQTEAFLGKSKNDVKGGVKLKTGLNYKLGETSDFAVGPRVNLHTALEKINDDIKGAFAPELALGGKYNHTFDSGVKVGAEANVGVAARLGYDKRHEGVRTFVDKMTPTYNAEASLGYKDAALVVSGGKDVHIGNNVAVGARFNF